jgi:outer membrane biosynthesis protein TonB
MKPSEMLSQVKTLLGVEVKLEQMKLENGTVLEADAFAEGNEIFIVTEDERVALPVGEYVLEDGQILVIEEEGLIKEMKSEDEEAKEEEVEVEAEEEEKEEMGYATKEELAEVKSMIEEIKAMLEPKEEMSEEPKEELKEEVELSEVPQEVVNEIPEEVKQELSEPAAEPINTNAEVSKTQVKFNIASKRKMSTLDRVMSKINKL